MSLTLLLRSPGGVALTLADAFTVRSQNAYADTILATSGLVAYWRLGETAGQPQDSFGTNHTTTTAGTPDYRAAGAIGDGNAAISFDGATEYFTAPDAAALDVADAYSVEFWFKRASLSGTQVMISKGVGQFDILFESGTNKISLSSQGYGAVTSDTNWHHAVITRNGPGAGNTLYYKDGVESHTDVSTSVTYASNATALSIGSRAGTFFFSGSLDEVAIYNTALSAATVLAHYNAGTVGGFGRTLTGVRAWADSTSLADALVRVLAAARAWAEGLTFSDVFDAVKAAGVKVAAFADALGLSDAVTRTTAAVRAYPDSLAIAATLGRTTTAARSLADGVTFGDALTRVVSNVRSFADAMTLATALLLDATGARLLAFADALAISDAVTRTAGLVRSLADAVTMSDALAAAKMKLQAFADALATSDTLARVVTLPRSFADAVASSSALVFSRFFGRSFGDALTTSSTLARTVAAARTFSDTVARSDVLGRAGTFGRSFVDAVSAVAEFVALRFGALPSGRGPVVRAWHAINRVVGISNQPDPAAGHPGADGEASHDAPDVDGTHPTSGGDVT